MSEKIEVVMRQTDYDHITAEQKLAEHNDDVLQVIREYLNAGKITAVASNTKLSTNQQIYKEIRGMMDDAAKTYLQKK